MTSCVPAANVCAMWMMRMMDAWIRGTHPLCGWLRLLLLPLMLVPVWFGYLWGGMLVMTVWMLVPMLFGKPANNASWMTRACLGVQIWRSRPLSDVMGLLLLLLTTVALVLGMGAAGAQMPAALGACLLLYFVSYLMFLSRCQRTFSGRLRQLSTRT